MLDFFRGVHSWRKLANLLDRLPLSSAYREAWSNDPEVADFLLDQPEPPPSRPQVPLSEYDTQTALLADVLDRLGDVIVAVVGSAGGKPPKLPPAPRPVTGVERARARRERLAHEALVDEVKAAQERWRKARSEVGQSLSE